eukprot:8421978-Alexandrium_andersonii.AAC.1
MWGAGGAVAAIGRARRHAARMPRWQRRRRRCCARGSDCCCLRGRRRARPGRPEGGWASLPARRWGGK